GTPPGAGAASVSGTPWFFPHPWGRRSGRGSSWRSRLLDALHVVQADEHFPLPLLPLVGQHQGPDLVGVHDPAHKAPRAPVVVINRQDDGPAGQPRQAAGQVLRAHGADAVSPQQTFQPLDLAPQGQDHDKGKKAEYRHGVHYASPFSFTKVMERMEDRGMSRLSRWSFFSLTNSTLAQAPSNPRTTHQS